MTNLRTVAQFLVQVNGDKPLRDIIKDARRDAKMNRKTCLEVLAKLEKAGVVTSERSPDIWIGEGHLKVPKFTERGLKAREILIELGKVDSRKMQY